MGEALPGGELSVDALADRVEQQTENYRQLIEIGSGSAGEARDGDALLALVQRKLEVMERVDLLEKDLAPVKEGWPAYLERLPEDRRSEIEEAMGRLARTLAELVEKEEAQQAIIEKKAIAGIRSFWKVAAEVMLEFIDGGRGEAAPWSAASRARW